MMKIRLEPSRSLKLPSRFIGMKPQDTSPYPLGLQDVHDVHPLNDWVYLLLAIDLYEVFRCSVARHVHAPAALGAFQTRPLAE